MKQAKSTLYHEIQHAIQDIEGFAYGERLEQISKDNYRLRHGEVEARNVQKRLDLDARAYAKIKDGKFYSGEKEIQAELANDKEYQKALREFQKSLDKDTKKSGREWERHENLRSFLTQRERQVEAKFEKSEPMTIEQGHLPHPHKTMDTPLKDTIAQASMQGEALSKELEKSFLDESGRIAYKSLMQNAEKLPKELNLRAFREQFKGQKYAIIKTPIKDVKINTDYAFYHLLKSGNGKENRKYISGGILATLQNPLFVTKDERGSYYFYKPFKINENLINLVSVEVDKNDKLLYKTSYEASKNKLKSMIEKYDLIYFAGGIQPVRAE
ncbi:hypothetical protein PUT20_001420 [Campylobacter upsaliensis]|nr:hypothetical protein [Campylobacter upsaliensis]